MNFFLKLTLLSALCIFIQSCSEIDQQTNENIIKQNIIEKKDTSAYLKFYSKSQATNIIVTLNESKNGYFNNSIILQKENTNELNSILEILKNGYYHISLNQHDFTFQDKKGNTIIFTTKDIESYSSEDIVFEVVGLIKHFNNKQHTIEMMNSMFTTKSRTCDSGGEGASSCSAESPGPFGSCSVSCKDGYYACCNDSSNICKCVKESPNLSLDVGL